MSERKCAENRSPKKAVWAYLLFFPHCFDFLPFLFSQDRYLYLSEISAAIFHYFLFILRFFLNIHYYSKLYTKIVSETILPLK